MKTEDKQPILDIAKRFAEKHQIIYSDVHVRLTQLVIEETIKAACKCLTRQDVVYDMDLYRDQEPLKSDHRL
jgi:hypothetical protein